MHSALRACSTNWSSRPLRASDLIRLGTSYLNHWSYMCSRGYICKSSYYHHQIGIIIPFPLLSYFPWLCAWGGCTIIRYPFLIYIYIYVYMYIYIYLCVCIYISRDGWVLFFYYCAVLWCALINRVHYGLMVVLVCLYITLLHYHHYADVSGSIEFLKCLFSIFSVRVCV